MASSAFHFLPLGCLSCLVNGVLPYLQRYSGIRWGVEGLAKRRAKETEGMRNRRATRGAPAWLRSVHGRKVSDAPYLGTQSLSAIPLRDSPTLFMLPCSPCRCDWLGAEQVPVYRTPLSENARWRLFLKVPDSISPFVTGTPESPWRYQTLLTCRPLSPYYFVSIGRFFVIVVQLQFMSQV